MFFFVLRTLAPNNNYTFPFMTNMNYHTIVNISHIAMIAPVLWYVATQRGAADPRAFTALQLLAVAAAGWHAWRLLNRFQQ